MNEMAARTGARQIPLPSNDLIKKAQDAEDTEGPMREKHKQYQVRWRNTRNARKADADRAREQGIVAGLAALSCVQ